MEKLTGYRQLSAITFKQELLKLHASERLLKASSGRTLAQFINNCQDPTVIFELLTLKAGQEGFPSKRKVNILAMRCAFMDTALFFLHGKKAQLLIKSRILKSPIDLPSKMWNSLEIAK